MSVRDFLLLLVICLFWGLNIVVSRFVVVDAPAMFYAFARFALLALVLAPFLWPIPRQLGLVFIVAMGLGAANFALLFVALQQGTASAVGVAGQLGLPFTTLLSVFFLGERVGWVRALGMALAFAGVVVIAYQPGAMSLSLGVVLSACAALVGSVGGVVMKRMEPIGAFQLQAWVAMFSWPVLGALTLLTERDQIEGAMAMGWPFLAALLFSVFCVSMFGHAVFYTLVKRYEVTLLSPLTLMTPVWTVVFGALLLHEPVTPKLLIGAAIALFGVGMIAIRPNLRVPEAAMFWRRWSS